MKKDIKFRVWDNVGYMSSPFTLQDLQEGKISFTSDCPVMQFTGMYDKNDKPIYEGDIVIRTAHHSLATNEENKPTQGIIKWTDIRTKFFVSFDKNRYADLDATKGAETVNDERIEVIGNIYESPSPSMEGK